MALENLHVRDEQPGDHADVRHINEAAFETPAEASLVDALRQSASPLVSLVCTSDAQLLGHILFSPVSVDGRTGPWMGLAPMAVAPQVQHQGIGTALVQAGMARCKAIGITGIVVLGHPDYYPSFGFRPAHTLGLTCVYDVPPQVFMAYELVAPGFDGCSGLVRYHRAFDDV